MNKWWFNELFASLCGRKAHELINQSWYFTQGAFQAFQDRTHSPGELHRCIIKKLLFSLVCTSGVTDFVRINHNNMTWNLQWLLKYWLLWHRRDAVAHQGVIFRWNLFTGAEEERRCLPGVFTEPEPVSAALCWKYSARSEDITTHPRSLFSRSDLNQFTNSIMLSLNTGWEMMNDYVKHIISLLHHHSNMTAKFHSSYPISSLFKERKLLVPVIRYVVRLCARVKPTPIRLSALLLL